MPLWSFERDSSTSSDVLPNYIKTSVYTKCRNKTRRNDKQCNYTSLHHASSVQLELPTRSIFK